jgi:hypothetical protein
MRLPAVAIAAPFACGIALGLHPAVERNASENSAELLERLANAGVRIMRTDRDGAVHVLTDGVRVEITRFVACLEVASVAPSMQRTEEPKR